MALQERRFRRGERVWWLPNEGEQRQVVVWDDSGQGLVTIVEGKFPRSSSPTRFEVQRYALSARPFQGVPQRNDHDAA